MPKERLSLLVSIRFASALGFLSLSLTGEISPLYQLMCWVGWGASFLLDRSTGWGQTLRKWETAAVIVMVTVFLIDFFHWDYSIFICVAHFLMLFQLFKIIGLKERKDNLQILVFSFFQMLSACTLSVDAWQAVILVLLIPAATAGLFWQQINLEVEESKQPLTQTAMPSYRRWITGMCLAAIPVNILFASVMFMLFPRLAFRGAFSGLGAGRSGYNEQVNLSQTGVIGEDNTSVLWLQIQPPEDRGRWKGYLRGGTLDAFDGKRWSRSPGVVAQTMYADTNGVFRILNGHHGLHQSVTLVNTSGSTLFGSPTIGEVIAPLATLQAMSDGSVRWSSGWRKPLRYDLVSFEQAVPDRKTARTPDYLKLASVPLERTRALAHRIAPMHDPYKKAKAIESYLRSQYQYTLHPEGESLENPVEDFLFSQKKGPCGHFASAMAVMLRLEGVPSRIAAGYYKGSWNQTLQQYLMRERDAHAWVEAYIPNEGWVAFDPTPRVTSTGSPQKWLLLVREHWEYLNFQWDRLVIEYDLYSQVKAVKEIQGTTTRMNSAISQWVDKYLVRSKERHSESQNAHSAGHATERSFKRMGIGFLIALGVILKKLRNRSQPYDPQIAFYLKFLRQMAQKGYPKSPSETASEYADRIAPTPYAGQAHDVTQRYYQTRFSLRPTRS